MGEVIAISETVPPSLIDKMDISDSEDAFLIFKNYMKMVRGGDIGSFSFKAGLLGLDSCLGGTGAKFENLISLGESYDIWRDLQENDFFVGRLFGRVDENFSVDNILSTERIVSNTRRAWSDSGLYSLLQGLFTHERISKDKFYELDFKARNLYSFDLMYGPKFGFIGK